MRNWLLIFHILGAAAWLGGGLYSWFSWAALAKDVESRHGIVTLAEKADRYFGPAAVVTLLTGITLVLTEEAWGWGDTFVIIGLTVFLISAVWQPLVSAKVQKRLLAAVEGGGDMGAALGTFHRTAVVDVGILLVALWAMVTKIGA